MSGSKKLAWGLAAVGAAFTGGAFVYLLMPPFWRGRMKRYYSSVLSIGQSQAEEEREAMVDDAIMDTFPASDPPAWGSISKHSR